MKELIPLAVITLTLPVLVSAEWLESSIKTFPVKNILETIEDLSITSCQSRCKLNRYCFASGTDVKLQLGEVATCYLLTSGSNDQGGTKTIELYTVQRIGVSSTTFGLKPPVTSGPNPTEGPTTPVPLEGQDFQQNSNGDIVYDIVDYNKPLYVVYYAVKNRENWIKAEKKCKDWGGGHLASLRSQNEEDFLRKVMTSTEANVCWWSGLNDRDMEGDVVWSDKGDAGLYRSEVWKEGKSNNSGPKDCVMICSGGWRFVACSDKRPFICKKTKANDP